LQPQGIGYDSPLERGGSAAALTGCVSSFNFFKHALNGVATQKYKHQTWQVFCNDLTPCLLSQGEGDRVLKLFCISVSSRNQQIIHKKYSSVGAACL